MSASILEFAASHAGITPRQARYAVASALRSLHREAITRQEGVTAAVVETRFNFGIEACYHICGLFEHQRLNCDHDLPWSETLMRFAPETRKYRALIDYWLANGGDPEPLHLDELLPDDPSCGPA